MDYLLFTYPNCVKCETMKKKLAETATPYAEYLLTQAPGKAKIREFINVIKTLVVDAAKTVTGTFTAAATPLTVTGFTANKTGSQPVGTAITFTVTGSGGVTPYQSKWWIWNGSAWSLGRNWATGNTFTWTPTAAGSYIIHVWVRNAGATADAAEVSRSFALTITPASTTPLTVTSFTPDRTGSQPAGTAITFAMTNAGGVTPYQYKWWVWNGSAWSLGRRGRSRRRRAPAPDR